MKKITVKIFAPPFITVNDKLVHSGGQIQIYHRTGRIFRIC